MGNSLMALFDWKVYLDKNEDLGKAGINTEQKAINHYKRYGRFEDRVCCIKPNEKEEIRIFL